MGRKLLSLFLVAVFLIGGKALATLCFHHEYAGGNSYEPTPEISFVLSCGGDSIVCCVDGGVPADLSSAASFQQKIRIALQVADPGFVYAFFENRPIENFRSLIPAGLPPAISFCGIIQNTLSRLII